MPAAVRPQQAHGNRKATMGRGVHTLERRKSPHQLTVIESISRPDPTWLPAVMVLRKGTTPVAIVSIIGVMLIYGVNVLIQREWSNQFETLETLQHQHSALVTQIERKKYQIPRDLEIDAKDYVNLNQENTIFIQPETSRPLKAINPEPRQSLLREDRVPIGY